MPRPQFKPRDRNATADEIRAVRINAGLTQSQFADALQVSTSSVESWERAANPCKMPRPIWKLAKILFEDDNRGNR